MAENTKAAMQRHRGIRQEGTEVCDLFIVFFFIKKIFLSLFVFNFLREREKEQAREGREREREGDRIPRRLRAARAEPDEGLELLNCEIMT